MSIQKFYFEVRDVKDIGLDKKYDQVWLFDVLEHVDDPRSLLAKIKPHLRGDITISVPTDDYVKVFGEEFDKSIGHQRHYDISDLEALLNSLGYEVIAKERYTQGLARRCCIFWTKYVRGHGARTLLLFPILNLLSFEDKPGSNSYCSILVKARVKT